MIVMGVDPGGTTGVAVVDISVGVDGGLEAVLLHSSQMRGAADGLGYLDTMHAELAVVEQLVVLLAEHQPDLCIVEDFILGAVRGGTVGGYNKRRSGLSPVRITSMFETWIYAVLKPEDSWTGRYGRLSASESKMAVSDEYLRSLGFWIVGQEHARDALRLCVLGYRRAE